MQARSLTPADRGAVAAYLDGRLVECLFLASNLEARGLAPGDGLLQGAWHGAFREGELVGLTQCVNQGSLLVAFSDPAAAEALGEAVVGSGFRPLRVLGMRSEVEDVFATLRSLGDHRQREIRDALLQVLTPETFEPREGGGMRLATLHDFELLLEWKRAFRIEAMGDDPDWVDMDVLKKSLVLSLGEARQFVFEAGGRVVSMVRLNARTRRMAQLGGVFTPEEERGNGYASRLVSGLCRHCFQREGKEAVALTVDAGKERANALYHRLGFLGLGTFRFLLLEG